jgi:hypothetical protein
MKRKILAILVTITALFAVGVSPAAAVQNKQCSIGGYTYYSAIDFSRNASTGNVTFNWWTITASSGGLPMEYRVRWFAPNGSTVIYDTTYVASTNINPGANVNVSRYLPGGAGAGGSVLVNAGKSNDGNPTCETWYTIANG